MKIEWKNFPVDILICFIWSIIIIPVVALDLQVVRIVLGLPFILFIPGYVLVFALFPGRDISTIERVALSFGLSIAVVPLVGLALNYTPWGIRLEPILTSLVVLVFILSAIGWYRWHRLSLKKRFFVSVDIHLPKAESKVENVLTMVLVISILVTLFLLAYIIVTPRVGESFTEFYLLGPSGKAEGYPANLSIGENGSVIIGIVNHEHEQVNYTVEIWIVNQTWEYNESSQENESVIHNMWFMEKIHTPLNHTKVKVEGEWEPQWEYNYSFNITKKGVFKIAFLLFREETKEFIRRHDYLEEESERVSRVSQYDEDNEDLHIWVTVIDAPPETIITSGPSGTIKYNDVTFTWAGSDDVTPAEYLTYSYVLEGYESTWSPWSYRTIARYYNLANGNYTFKVKARDMANNSDPTPAERSFTVQVEVPIGARLSYSPSSHDFGDMRKGQTGSATFDIWNSGTGTLTYSLSKTCNWVDVSATSGSSTGEHDVITVSIDTTGLPLGFHSCDVSITSNGGSGTFTIEVNVVGPVVSIEDGSAEFCNTVVVPITITNVANLSGVNIWLRYDNNVVEVKSVASGDLGSITINIDNDNNTTYFYWFSTTSHSGSFVFAYISLHAVGSPGQMSSLNIDVKSLVEQDGTPIDHAIDDGLFKVLLFLLSGDINRDGFVNVLDMNLVKQKWGMKGPSGWIPEDINGLEGIPDGVIDIWDMILIIENWTE